jgi:hypothetical protein
MKFSKAFLSHSSNDKKIVREVCNLLAASRREFDEETFEGGKRNAEEIFNYYFQPTVVRITRPNQTKQRSQKFLFSTGAGGALGETGDVALFL